MISYFTPRDKEMERRKEWSIDKEEIDNFY